MSLQTHFYPGLLIQARYQSHITVRMGAQTDNRL